MMNGFTVRKSAEICGINKDTAFIWRHKILDAMQNMQAEVTLDGIMEDKIMINLNDLDNTYAIEYREKGLGVPLYLTKKGTYEEQLPERCIPFEKALSIAKEKNLVFSAEGSAYKSTYRIALKINEILGFTDVFIPTMIYFQSMENGTNVPEKVFEHITKEQLLNWYKSLKD